VARTNLYMKSKEKPPRIHVTGVGIAKSSTEKGSQSTAIKASVIWPGSDLAIFGRGERHWEARMPIFG
jgi:hypothetical protein